MLAQVSYAVTMALQDQGSQGGSTAGSFIGFVVGIACLVAIWRIYTKAGQPGWAAIIPIYNTIVMLKVVQRPLWWFLLLLVPGVNLIIGIIVLLDLAKVFGKGVGFGIGLILLAPIFLLILGFGSASYVGRGAAELAR